MGFARDLREELAHVAVDRSCCRRAESAALLRAGGSLHLAGGPDGGVRWVLETESAAVARRARATLDALYRVRPEIELHEPGNLRRVRRYRLTVQDGGRGVLRGLGLLDARGRPREAPPVELVSRACCAAAYVRGALMASGSVSEPAREPHLELRAPGEESAVFTASVIRRVGGHPAGVQRHGESWRVVLKAGPAIGTLLAATGAHQAFLRWDEGRLRRELRGDANRKANADRANVQRSVTAAARQIEAAERALASAGWDDLADELRQVALARLANPEASLAELGGLLDPPVGKSAVYRRLMRLVQLAESEHV